MNQHRVHGDMVDKSYRHDAKGVSSPSAAAEARLASQTPKPQATDKSTARVNCSADEADCTASHGKASQRMAGSSGDSSAKGAKNPTAKLDDKANVRTKCNEADVCTASSRAASSVWGQRGASATHGSSAFLGTAGQGKQVPGAVSRLLDQKSAPVSGSAADDGEPYTSSLQTKQFYAYEAVKKGTFTGPGDASGARAQDKNAESAVKALKAAKQAKP